MELPSDCRDTTPLTATVQHLFAYDTAFFPIFFRHLGKNAKNYQKYIWWVLKMAFFGQKRGDIRHKMYDTAGK